MHVESREPRRLVFVAGLHRSGTTPLARALAEHPEMSGLTDTGVIEDEGQHLQTVYPAARNYGGPGRFARDARAHLTEASALVSAENASRLWDAWEPYWDLDAEHLIEKSPPNLVMGRFLQALFPGSAMVVVIRNPIVVALSTEKWRRVISRKARNHASLHQMVEHSVIAHRIFLDDLPYLERVAVLRYEDLVRSPNETLAGVQELLGLESPIPTESISMKHSSQYEERWNDMRSGNFFKKRVYEAIKRDFADDLANFGYDVEDLTKLRPWTL